MGPLLLLLAFFCLSHVGLCAESEYFAICTCVKFEPDLAEWVEYHLRMGTSKIYVYDNSDADYTAVERSMTWYRKMKYVVYERIEGIEAQRRAFEKCSQQYRNKHQFMAFIDADEFIVVVNKALSIPTVLKEYERYCGLALNWMEYGRAGHVVKPPGGVLKNYNKCKTQHHVKVLANTKFFTSNKFWSPHQLNCHQPTVNELHERVHTHSTPNSTYQKIYINHYVVKSIEDFARKSSRGSGWRPDASGKSWGYLESLEKLTYVDCPVLEMPTGQLS